MKGYKTSTDYAKLFDLANDGYRIPAWILYKDYPENPIFDIVEVKKSSFSDYISIGVRGYGHETFEPSKEAFIKNCESLQLKFIDPNN